MHAIAATALYVWQICIESNICGSDFTPPAYINTYTVLRHKLSKACAYSQRYTLLTLSGSYQRVSGDTPTTDDRTFTPTTDSMIRAPTQRPPPLQPTSAVTCPFLFGRFTGNQIAFEDSYGSESESDDDDFTPALQGGSRTNQHQLGWSNKPALAGSPPDRPASARLVQQISAGRLCPD